MKKLLTILMLLAIAVPAWAGEQIITISRNDGQFESSSGVYYASKGGVTMSISGGMNNPNFLLLKHENTISFKSKNFAIKEIVFHCLDDFLEGNNDVFYWGPTTMNVLPVNINGQSNAVTPGKYTASGYDGHWVSNFSGTWTSTFKGITRTHTPYPDGYPTGNSLTFESMGKPIRFASIDIVIEKESGDIYELVTKNDQVKKDVSYMLVGRADASTTTGRAMSINSESDNSNSGYNGIKSTEVELIDNGFRVKANDEVQFINLSQSTFTTPGNEYFPWYLNINSTQSIKTGSIKRTGTQYNNGYSLEYQNTPAASSSTRYRHSVSIFINNEESQTNFDHDAVIKYYNQINYYVSGLDDYKDCQIRHNNDINLFRNLLPNESDRQKVFLYMPAKQYKVTTEVQPNEDYGSISLRDGILIDNDGVSWSQQMETVQFLVTPANGYKVKSITIQQLNGTEVVGTVDILSSNQSINGTLYNFVMPGNDVNIVVEFEEVQYHNVNIVIDPDQRCGNVFLTEGYVVQNDQVKSYDGQNVVFNVTYNLININDESEGYYELKSVTVTDDITGQSITYNLSNGNYSFTMPDHDVTITATFKQDAPEPLYLLGTANGGYWTYNNGNNWHAYGPVFNYNKNIGYYLDVYYKGTGEFEPGGNTENAYGFFSLSKRYADNDDWGYLNGYRLVAKQSNGGNEDIDDGGIKPIYADNDNNRNSSFRIPAGIYRIVVDKNMTQVSITRKSISLNFDPAGGSTINQPETVSSGTNVSLMGSLYNVIQSVNSNIITPPNTPLYNANHDDANFKYKALKTIGENTTNVGPTASTTVLNTTLDVLNDGETVTKLDGWNYLGWIVASNTGYYKVIDTPLRWIEENGKKDNTYTVSDKLQGVYAQGTSLWCKDLGNISIVKTTPNTGQVDFLMNDDHCKRVGGWDQSNWVELDFSGFDDGETRAQAGVEHYIEAGSITGEYTDDVNYKIKVKSNLSLTEAPEYVPNHYCTANFIEGNLKIGENVGPTVGNTTYYFLNPKIQEYAIITYAMWDKPNQIMVIPNNNPFSGAARIGMWDLNKYGNQLDNLDAAALATPNNQYEFHIIVQRNDKTYGSPATRAIKPNQAASTVIKIQPLDLQTSSPMTAINTVGTEAQVVGVEYVNIAGMRSSKPFKGVNIVVTRYSDGSTTTSKVIK